MTVWWGHFRSVKKNYLAVEETGAIAFCDALPVLGHWFVRGTPASRCAVLASSWGTLFPARQRLTCQAAWTFRLDKWRLAFCEREETSNCPIFVACMHTCTRIVLPCCKIMTVVKSCTIDILKYMWNFVGCSACGHLETSTLCNTAKTALFFQSRWLYPNSTRKLPQLQNNIK